MPTAVRSRSPEPAGPGGRPWDLGRFLGWNLPFLLWTAWAGATAWVVPALGWGGGLGACLVRRAGAPWCPGCGLTTAYAGLLSEGRWPGWFPAAVIGGFVVILIGTAVAWWRRR
jgi:hypothetical protein